MKKIIPLFLLWAILLPFTCGSTAEHRVIRTKHFIITAPSDLIGSSLEAAALAEKYFEKICDFLEFMPPGRIELDLARFCDRACASGSGYRHLALVPVCCPGVNDLIFSAVFESCMASFAGNFKTGISPITSCNENLFSALKDYIRIGINSEDVMLLNDYIEYAPSGKEISLSHEKVIAPVIWKFLLGFTEKTRGRNLLARSLKDYWFYGGFIRALATLTGMDQPGIDSQFAEYLALYKNDQALPSERESYRPLAISEKSEVVSCSADSAGGYVYLLEKSDHGYEIAAYSPDTRKKISIDLDDGPCYAGIVSRGEIIFMWSRSRGGSVLYCISVNDKKLLWERELPFFFIDYLAADKSPDRLYLFTSGEQGSSVFLYDIGSSGFKKLSPSSGYIFHPSLTSSGEILYVKKADCFSIMLYNPVTDRSVELYRSINMLCFPCEDSEGGILYSEISVNSRDVYFLEPVKGEKRRITRTVSSAIMPLEIQGTIFFLDFSRGGWRPVFVTPHTK